MLRYKKLLIILMMWGMIGCSSQKSIPVPNTLPNLVEKSRFFYTSFVTKIPYEENAWLGFSARNISGLAKSEVYGIASAPDGSIWAATHRGVSHFDGENWVT